MFKRILFLALLALSFIAAPVSAVDTDADGIDDDVDNCRLDPNPMQVDADNDDIGNVCDGDIAVPNDCQVNFLDLGAMKAAFFTTDPVADLVGPGNTEPDGQVNFFDLGRIKEVFFSLPGPSATGCDAPPANVPGEISLSGTTLVGEVLTATVTDDNGTGVIDYQWQADGVDIGGATLETLTLTAAQRGALISVNASYTDNDGFAEGPLVATAADITYSAIATGEATLQAAAGAAVAGDIIGLASASGGDDYADMAEVLFDTDNLLVRRTADSTAVISGATCVAVTGDGIVIDGLVFDVLDWLAASTCDSQGDGSVFIGGDAVTLRNSQFLGEAFPRTVPGGDPYHYITLKGVGNLIERNSFAGKDMDNEGSIISIFADPNDAPDFDPSNENHTIQYNLFKDIVGKSGVAGNRNSTAHALQIGRSTGSDSTGDGLVKVLYNRFENVESERRIMRVQSGGNLIQGNTFIDTLGMIALEDGYASTVTQNIILSMGDDSDDGGISFAPLGHTVTDNYINNMRTTSGQRAALLLNPDPLSGSGNTALIASPPGDFTVTVARNTIVNARQAIQFEDADCADLPPLLDFDDNFVMNQTGGPSINDNSNGSGRDAVTDDDWTTAGCALDPASTFADNHFYSAVLSTSTTFDFNGNLAGNTVGGEDGATFTQDGNTQPFATGGLVNGSGADTGVGVDTSTLELIEESQVGPGSTWTTGETNNVAVIIDTDPGDTGELRYALGGGGPLAAGRVEARIKRLDDALGDGDAFITLFNSETNNAGAILDFRIRDDSFAVRSPDTIDTSSLPHTLGAFMDVVITWEYPGGDTLLLPEVTITVDGVSLAPFMPDNSAFGGVTHVAFRFGDNSGVRAATGKYSVDDFAIYSDTAGTVEVFADDFESYEDGASLDTDNPASPYNSSTSEATVETIGGVVTTAFEILVNADKQAFTEVASRFLDSDGVGIGLSAYDLITNLGGAGSIEAPDLYAVNHPPTPHIFEAFDAQVGNHFVFVIHRDIDIDRDRTDITDRQRNEIKTFGPSEDAVKGYEDETMAFEWKFRINSDMEVSKNFSHFFQLKAVGGDDSQPVVSLTGNERTGEDGLEIRQSPAQDFDILGRIDWSEVTGEWVEVYCRATFSDQGSLRLIAGRLSDQQILFDVTENNVDMWRGDSADHFVRPKWGIYRSLLDAGNLRPDEEDVAFANFTISKLEPV
ncbi:MAG: chondroitinase-B domain-containing protein [Pseudomonadota bacterium]